MYLWNVDSLIKDINENKITEKEQLKYTLAYSILMLIASDPLVHYGLMYSYMDTISSIFVLAITVIGIIFCYKENMKVGGQDFILRFFTIGLPLTIRFIAIIFPIAIIFGVAEGILNPNETETETGQTSISQIIFTIIILSIFYLYYAKKFRQFTPHKNP